MKICFFTTDFPPTLGGISEFSRSIAYHMPESSRVEHVQVIALKNQQKGIENPNKKLSIIRDDKKSFISLFLKVLRFGIQYRSYDVFHATSVFPIGFLTVLIGKYLFRKPVFVTFYGTDVLATLGSKKTKWAKIWTLKHATKAIAFSYSTRDEVARRHTVSLSQFAMVYYPLPDAPKNISSEAVANTKKQYGITQGDFIVLYVGHLVKRKGGEYLIRAIKEIPDPRVKLLFVNDGPERENFERLARDLGVSSRVVFAGKVPDVSVFYGVADVFSMPSFFYKEEGDIEGLGIVYLEAQQYGVPVLGTYSGGIPEAVNENKSGYLVPEKDHKALAEKIAFLQKNPVLRKEMGEHGKKFVREKFDWRKSVNGHLDLYDAVWYK